MPKKTYKILRFDGGINNDADPRDIGDNQFADLQNVAVDEMGKIIVLGDCTTARISGLDGILSVKGRGLFVFAADYNGICGDTTGPKTYFLVEDGHDIRGMQTDGSDEAAAMGGWTNLGTPTYYAADGILRVGDADHDNASLESPRWKGYIKRVQWGGNDSADGSQMGHVFNLPYAAAASTEYGSKWVETVANIKGCFQEVTLAGDHATADSATVTVGKNLIMADCRSSNFWTSASTDPAIDNNNAPGFDFGNAYCDTGAGPDDDTESQTGMYWGVGLMAHSLEDGTGTWMPTTDTKYQLYATTMYDNHTQESLPQLFTMYPTTKLVDGTVYNATDGVAGNFIGATPTTGYQFPDGIDFASPGENVSVTFQAVAKWNGREHSDDTDIGPGLISSNKDYEFAFGAVDGSGVPDISESSRDNGNPRISGVRIYWASSEDGFSTLWQLIDWDFNKGQRAIGASGTSVAAGGYTQVDSSKQDGDDTKAWTVHLHGNGILGGTETAQHSAGYGFKWDNPPRYFQYDVLNGHPYDDTIEVDSFKTAVVANRRVYIGNVQQDGVIKEDRMLKSPVNQFDKFPEVNNIDVAINDGDSIIHLIEYADRIIQFKENTTYIINISGASEFLEAEHKFKGISNPGAACRMDYGVAWVNQNGCYLYDGQQVTDLLEDQGMRKLNLSDPTNGWSTFIGSSSNEIIGFNPVKRQLIVKGDSSDVYIYDMVTKSWTKSGTSMITTNHSNFVNDPADNKLLVFSDDSPTDSIMVWNDAPTADKSIVITTKDIDFGEPAVRKKVYKAYITYKCNTSTLPTVYYDTDGNTTLTTAATVITGFVDTNNQWTRAEFKFRSDANSCYSIQLKISGTADTTFEINDISLIYRTKGIK